MLSGERLGRLMVQSALDQGLCAIFNAIIGFEGDEFYCASAASLGLAGKRFQEAPFWCSLTTPIEVRDALGAYHINPVKDYVIQEALHGKVVHRHAGRAILGGETRKNRAFS